MINVNKRATNPKKHTAHAVVAQRGEGPIAQIISAAHQGARLNTRQANLHLARGPGDAPLTSASLEGYAPLGRVSASLEGYAPLGRVSASLKGYTTLERVSASLEGYAGL
jgi:hypothetical protein